MVGLRSEVSDETCRGVINSVLEAGKAQHHLRFDGSTPARFGAIDEQAPRGVASSKTSPVRKSK